MAFDSELRDCFGESDLMFAGHPLGEVSAFKWLISLREREALDLPMLRHKLMNICAHNGIFRGFEDKEAVLVEVAWQPSPEVARNGPTTMSAVRSLSGVN